MRTSIAATGVLLDGSQTEQEAKGHLRYPEILHDAGSPTSRRKFLKENAADECSRLDDGIERGASEPAVIRPAPPRGDVHHFGLQRRDQRCCFREIQAQAVGR